MGKEFVLSLSCEDRLGIVARVSSFLASSQCNIRDAQQLDDPLTNRFFMRVVFDPDGRSLAELRGAFAPIASDYAMQWRLADCGTRRKVLIMVSKFDHCLVDLLYRMRIGEIAMDVVGVVSNHDRDSEGPPMLEGIPFHHLPVTPESKPAQESRLRALIEETGTELVVLARYMQILSEEMVEYLSGRCINIHHSFLPGFKGARPYHQAYRRGVKLIGATSHYVTADLDEGPIIAQDVEPVTNRDLPEDFVAKGRDVERRVLAKAVKAHLEDRVFLNGSRTVVFDG